MSNKGPSEVQLVLQDVMSLKGMKRYLIVNEDGTCNLTKGTHTHTRTHTHACMHAVCFVHCSLPCQLARNVPCFVAFLVDPLRRFGSLVLFFASAPDY